jgi:hypothetical protein
MSQRKKLGSTKKKLKKLSRKSENSLKSTVAVMKNIK